MKPGQPLRAAVSVISYFLFVSVVNGAPDQQAPPAQPAAPEAQATVPESPNDLLVTVGKSVIVNSAATIERVSVGFGEVAEATAVTPNEVLVNGKAPGETSLIVWQQGGTKLYFDVVVRPSRFATNTRIDAIRREMRTELPGQTINVSLEGDSVFLRGRVHDLNSADRAIAIASTLGKPVNLLYVDVPPAETQILLKVKFASVDRSTSTELGLNIASLGAAGNIGVVSTGEFSPPIVTRNPDTGVTTMTLSDALNISILRPDLNLAATIKALQTRSLLEVLAEPNLLAMNGRQASFLAGGEYPFPTLQGGGAGLGQVTIQFREFGIRLNFIPTITSRGTIRLQVAPEVSSLDFPGGLVFQGFRIPAIATRRVNTEIELEPGQSFAIGGLLDNRMQKTLEKIPILGDIPWLGKLFQSKSETKNNTELLVLVTPELVRPIPAGQRTPELTFPGKFLPPNSAPDAVRTPGLATTGPVPVAAPPAEGMPIESLREAMRPESPLIVEGKGGSTFPPQPQQSYFPVLAPAAAPAAAPAPAAPAPAATPPAK